MAHFPKPPHMFEDKNRTSGFRPFSAPPMFASKILDASYVYGQKKALAEKNLTCLRTKNRSPILAPPMFTAKKSAASYVCGQKMALFTVCPHMFEVKKRP